MQALLDQDPFVTGGPQTPLASDRFEARTGIISEGAPFTRTLTTHVSEDDTHAHLRIGLGLLALGGRVKR